MDRILDNIPEELLLALLENPYEGLILIDADGIIRFMSSLNKESCPINVETAIGRHISEVSPDSRLPRVLKTGKAEIGRSTLLKSRDRVGVRIPLFHKGRVVGVAGKLMFMNLAKFKELYRRIEDLKTQIDSYRFQLNQVDGGRYTFENMIGESALVRKAGELARQAAVTDTAVIITGEAGTGKDRLARTIHQSGNRHRHNFIKVNCAAMSNEAIKAELLGQDPGRIGKLELAHNGTLFLDEIGDMPLDSQDKLFRVLREKRVGRWLDSEKPTTLDYRVICATSRNMKDLIEKKEFHSDLYHHLNGINIQLPALRNVKDDIRILFFHFLNELSTGAQYGIPDVSDDVLDAVNQHAWPGNVHELRNTVERAFILSRGRRIEPGDLPFAGVQPSPVEPRDQDEVIPLKQLIADTERRAIQRALEKTGNNRAEAAKKLGIHRTGLYQKLKKYNIP
jgi:transcriptional regulator with PAS, ATPase and Fis domain